MGLLKAKRSYNTFGKCRVIDYFVHIEFQHRGFPHAHIILWLDNDPRESISEEVPQTLQMMTDLCSVSRDDLPKDDMYGNQVHRHTFTCTKQGEESCRFNIPHWPLPVSRVFLPLPKDEETPKN
jgi:predicted Mrr-cat superfamily restriction endonuclease